MDYESTLLIELLGIPLLNLPKPLVCFVFLLSFAGTAANLHAVVVLDFVEVGDPGNLPLTDIVEDGTSGYGAVDYTFRIGEYEVTNSQYVEFLNAVAATDTNGLYGTAMSTSVNGGITRSGSNGNYTYATKTNFGNKPVNYLSWFSAARFTNWLQNGQPVGPQNASTTEDGAYTFSSKEIVGPRNPGATFYLPNEHEWVKAGFYEPGAVTKNGDEYWYHATGSDIRPVEALSDALGNAINPGPNTIVHNRMANWNGSTLGNVLTVGSAGNQSYYGAKDMAGNVFEWLEADVSKPDPFGAGPYIVRGGSFWNAGHIFNTERNNGPKVGDGDTDGADFLTWQREYGNFPGPLFSDFDHDFDVDADDLVIWQSSYGVDDAADADVGGHIHNERGRTVGFRVAAVALPSALSVPEPSSIAILELLGLLWFGQGRRTRRG